MAVTALRTAWGAPMAQTSVLLVDDRPANLTALRAVLEPLGQTLLCATSGAEALRVVGARSMAVVLLDVRLPDLSGFEVARRMRRDVPELPIIFLTAELPDPRQAAEAYALGAVDFITKPFDSEALRSKVQVFVKLTLQREALQRHELLERERALEAEARLQQERFSQQLKGVAQASVEIAHAADEGDLLRLLGHRARALLQARVAVVCLQSSPPCESVDAAAEASEAYLSSARQALPGLCQQMAEAGKPLRLGSAELEERPALRGRLRAFVGAPLTDRSGATLGVLCLLDKAEGGDFSDADEAVLVQLSQLASAALENARLLEGTRRAQERQAFLAEASRELASSLDFEKTLRSVARLAVPRYADWAAVDMVGEDGKVWRLAVEHADPAKVQLAHELHERYPPDLSQPRGLGEVLRTGAPEWLSDIPDELLVAGAKDEEHLRIARELGLRSYLVVPLKANDKVMGAITLVHAESGRRFAEADVALMEKLASRGALAIENARLYREVRVLNDSLESRVRERTRELEEANRELESFSYSVSHDLRAPLRHLAGFAQLLEKRLTGSLDDTSREYLDSIADAARQGGRLVDELLAFSRMGRAEMRQLPVLLPDLVEQVRTELARETRERSIDWRVGPLPMVRADPSMLRLVVMNLLSNAVKYTRPRKEALIEVGAREGEGEVEVWVKDNGVGFDMRYVEKLFGVFQRLHVAEEFEGTGIGLANVRRIILRHGGRVWAEGEEGRGATFHFTLPRPPSAALEDERGD